jgi:hypothetical protein
MDGANAELIVRNFLKDIRGLLDNAVAVLGAASCLALATSLRGQSP